MKHLFIPLIALLLFASCAEENMPEFATGYLQITSLEARIGEVETESVTRTVSPELNVDICDETGTEIIVSLPAGEIYNP